MEWTIGRVAGAVFLVGTLLPVLPSLFMLTRGGDLHAATAMFRDVSGATGQVPMFKVQCASYAFWGVASLTGMVLLATALIEAQQRALGVLVIVFFSLYAFIVVAEATFHYGVTSWAIEQTEQGVALPELYLRLKRWLNVQLQVAINPLAMISFVLVGWAILRTGMLPGWVGWSLIGYGGVFAFFPLPLLIAPVPMLLGLALLLKG